MDENKVTVRELAQRLGLSIPSVYHLLSGRRGVSIETAAAIEQVTCQAVKAIGWAHARNDQDAA